MGEEEGRGKPVFLEEVVAEEKRKAEEYVKSKRAEAQKIIEEAKREAAEIEKSVLLAIDEEEIEREEYEKLEKELEEFSAAFAAKYKEFYDAISKKREEIVRLLTCKILGIEEGDYVSG